MRYRLKHQVLARHISMSRMSQNRWALKLGLSKGHLSQLVSGKRPFPGSATRRKLLRGTGLKTRDLFRVEDGGRIPARSWHTLGRLRLGAFRVRLERRFHSPQEIAGLAASSRWPGFGHLWKTLGYTVRGLLRHPAFSLVAVASLALGLGANSAVLSLIEAALLRPLPYPEAEGLVRVWESRGQGRGSVSVPNLEDWQRRSRSFQAWGGYQFRNVSYSSQQPAVRLTILEVTPSLFQMLGRPALLGSLPGASAVSAADGVEQEGTSSVVLSHSFWRTALGGDSEAVGRSIRLDGRTHVISAVMPEDFAFPPGYPAQLWRTLTFSSAERNDRSRHWTEVVARLRPGVLAEEAQAEMDLLAEAIALEHPLIQEGRGVALARLGQAGRSARRERLLIIWATVGLVLLVSVVNVANLLLARTHARTGELQIRRVLGASRVQLMFPLVLEGSLLGLAGGIAGLLAGHWITRLLAQSSQSPLFRGLDLQLNLTLTASSLAIALLCGAASSLIAMRRMGSGGTLILRGAPGTASRSGRSRIPQGLTAAQVAISALVIFTTGSLALGYWRLAGTPTGLKIDEVVSARIELPRRKAPQAARFFARLLEQVRAHPAVQQAGGITRLPLQSWGTNGGFMVEGVHQAPSRDLPMAEIRTVTDGYFAALGIPVTWGRGFPPDLPASPEGQSGGLVMVNQTLARRAWPQGLPGRPRIALPGRPEQPVQWLEVVGVVGDVRNAGLQSLPRPEVYFPLPQRPATALSLVLRGTAPARELGELLRREAALIDPDVPAYRIQAMEEVLQRALSEERSELLLYGLLCALSLGLTVAGIYGVTSGNLERRRHELGVRMALGADRRRLIGLVLRPALLLTLAAAAAAGFATRALSGWLSALSSRVEPAGLWLVLPLSVLLCLCVALACYLPLRRLLNRDPLAALRPR